MSLMDSLVEQTQLWEKNCELEDMLIETSNSERQKEKKNTKNI